MTQQLHTIQIPKEYKRLFDDDWREAAVYGGRGSLKSHTVARLLLIKARESKRRIGCFREYQNSIGDSSHQLLKELIDKYGMNEFKVTDNSITNMINGSDFIFKGLHGNEQSIKSIEGIDYAWVEEAQMVSNKSIEVLTPTVRKPGSKIIYTYNREGEEDPVHKRLVLEGRPNTLILNVNYDVALKYGWFPEVLRVEMEDDKLYRPGLYKHKWLGEPNMTEGRIFNDWNIVDEIPHEARLEIRGMDFGYARDPTVLVDIYYYNGGYIVDELIYRTNYLDTDLGNFILNNPRPNTLIIGDSADKQKIVILQNMGINIIGVDKRGSGGETFTRGAISFVQDQRMSITARSQNVIKSYRNFQWQIDREDNIIPKYDHYWSDGMMAVIYGMTNFNLANRRDREEAEPTYTGNIASLWG
jgi:phage terminase large subunit